MPYSDVVDQKVDSILMLMTLEEKIGRQNLVTSDMDVTIHSFVRGAREDIAKGRVSHI